MPGDDDSDLPPAERPAYAVAQGTMEAGVLGAIVGWVVSRIARRKRQPEPEPPTELPN